MIIKKIIEVEWASIRIINLLFIEYLSFEPPIYVFIVICFNGSCFFFAHDRQ